MARINLLSGFAVSALSLVTGISYGGTAVWDGSESTDWNDADNWVGGTPPATGDAVTIPNVANQPVFAGSGTSSIGRLTLEAGATVAMTSASTFAAHEVALAASAGTKLQISGASAFVLEGGSGDYDLSVGSGAVVEVIGNSLFEIGIPSGALTDIDGVLFIENGVLDITENVALEGLGQLQLGNDSGDSVAIEIAADTGLQVLLSNGVLVYASSTIDGEDGGMSANDGTFFNDAAVVTTGGGSVDFGATTDLQDSDGDWFAYAGTIRFRAQNLLLTGNFSLNFNGTYIFDEDVETSGTFACTLGDVVINGGSTFVHAGGMINASTTCP